MIFQVASIIKKVESMGDNGWRLKVDTQELSPDQVSQVAGLKDKYGYFLFKENSITEQEIPEEPAEFKKDKSPSKRLKDRMFVYYKNKNDETVGFNEWYSTSLEEIGQKYLDKIEEL